MAHKEPETGKRSLWQFIRFNMVGAVNSIIDFVVYWVLNLLLGWTYPAQAISYCCGMVNSYFMNSKWTFRHKGAGSARVVVKFILVNLAAMGVSFLGIWFFQNVVGITNVWVAGWMPRLLNYVFNGDTISKMLATFFAMLVSYFGSKRFVFTNEGPDAASGEGETEYAVPNQKPWS